MTAAAVSWPTVALAVVAIIGGVLVLMVLLVRAQKSRRYRVGFFVERDVEEPEQLEPYEPPDSSRAR